ncbi:hypothetical protein Tco_0175627 [Tanacetum coccineum]
MSTMAENFIIAGADNRLHMLERSQIDSWQSPTPTTPASTRVRIMDGFTKEEKIHEACDIRATNIVLQGLPLDVYTLVNHLIVSKKICDIVKLLIEGSELSLQERESKLNDMNTIGMTMQKLQVYTKFVNNLQPKWSRFVTDVKLVKDMHNSSFDQLYAYLRHYEVHVNEVHMMRQRFPNPIALVANTYNSPSFYNNPQPRYNPLQYNQQSSAIP